MTAALRCQLVPGAAPSKAAALNAEAQAALLGAWPARSEVNALAMAIAGWWFVRRAASCGYGSVRVGQHSGALTAAVLSPRLLGAPQLHPPTPG